MLSMNQKKTQLNHEEKKVLSNRKKILQMKIYNFNPKNSRFKYLKKTVINLQKKLS